MKIKDILNESVIVNGYWEDIPDDFDDMYNPEVARFSDDTKQYYKKYFETYFKDGVTPVFTKVDNSEHCNEKWKNKPDQNELQSAGYRGQQDVLKRAGVPHDKNVKEYDEHEIQIKSLKSNIDI